MAKELKRGDRVEWNYRGTKMAGRVERKLTARSELEGRMVAATEDDPRYVVRIERSGKRVAYRATALNRLA